MNERQQATYDFAMARVQAGKEEALKAVLAEQFRVMDAMRASGGFDRERMREMSQKVSALLTPDGAREYEEWRAARRRERGR